MFLSSAVARLPKHFLGWGNLTETISPECIFFISLRKWPPHFFYGFSWPIWFFNSVKNKKNIKKSITHADSEVNSTSFGELLKLALVWVLCASTNVLSYFTFPPIGCQFKLSVIFFFCHQLSDCHPKILYHSGVVTKCWYEPSVQEMDPQSFTWLKFKELPLFFFFFILFPQNKLKFRPPLAQIWDL